MTAVMLVVMAMMIQAVPDEEEGRGMDKGFLGPLLYSTVGVVHLTLRALVARGRARARWGGQLFSLGLVDQPCLACLCAGTIHPGRKYTDLLFLIGAASFVRVPRLSFIVESYVLA